MPEMIVSCFIKETKLKSSSYCGPESCTPRLYLSCNEQLWHHSGGYVSVIRSFLMMVSLDVCSELRGNCQGMRNLPDLSVSLLCLGPVAFPMTGAPCALSSTIF